MAKDIRDRFFPRSHGFEEVTDMIGQMPMLVDLFQNAVRQRVRREFFDRFAGQPTSIDEDTALGSFEKDAVVPVEMDRQLNSVGGQLASCDSNRGKPGGNQKTPKVIFPSCLRWCVLAPIGLWGQAGCALEVTGEMAIVFIADHGRNFVNPHLRFGKQAGDVGNACSCQLLIDRAAQLRMELIVQGAMRKVGNSDNIRYSDRAVRRFRV